MSEKQTISEIIEEVKTEICDNYWSWGISCGI